MSLAKSLKKVTSIAKSIPTPGTSVLVHTLNQKTDSLAKLGYRNRGYTYAEFQFTNPSSKEATYRIAYGNTTNSNRWKIGTEFKVAGSKSTVRRETGLRPNSRTIFFLERKEYGQWVQQTSTSSNKNYLSITTMNMYVSSSTSSRTALLTWVKQSGADHQVDIYDKKPAAGVKPIKTFAQNTVKTSGKTNTVTVTSLDTDKVYYGLIMIKEPNVNGESAFVLVDTFDFETSERANITLDPTKTFATSATMSWDKGSVGGSEADKKADFMIRTFILADKRWKIQNGMGMGWKTEGAKTFTQVGLTSGQKYLFQLFRRGVDGKTVLQASTVAVTKTTEMTVVNPSSTNVLVRWEPVYDKATYYVKYTPEKGTGTMKSIGNATSYLVVNLTPNTLYKVELIIKENNRSYVIKTDTFTTDRASILHQAGINNTTVTLQVETFNDENTRYFVQDVTKKIRTKVFNISKTGKTNVDLGGLEIGKTYKLNLFRAEHGRWNIQKWNNNTTDHINVRSNDFLVSTSVASKSALVTWDQTQASSEYTLHIFDKVPAANVDPKLTFSGTQIKTADGEHIVVVSGLVKQTKYYGVISGIEKNEAGVETLVKMKEFDFVTSSAAVFKLGKYFASYANFSWSPGNIKEADGVSEFKIMYYNYSTRKWNNDMAWQPDTNNTAVISGLSPGVKYRFDLKRLGVDGKETGQAQSIITMRTTKLEVDSVASRQIEAKWAPIYANAQYQLTYTPSGGKAVIFGGGPLTKTSASISGLTAGTDYKLELYVIENNKLVGISTSALGSAVNVSTGSNTKVYGLIAVFLAIVAVLVAMKMRKR